MLENSLITLPTLTIAFTILLAQLHSTVNAASLPNTFTSPSSLSSSPSSIEMDRATMADDYWQPNEVLPIQPVLLYPKARQLKYQSRKLDKDNEIIFVKLLKHQSYRPKKRPNQSDDGDIAQKNPPKELTKKDIFYVKALANGQFSHRRLKWYRLPEFYAISVFRKGEQV